MLNFEEIRIRGGVGKINSGCPSKNASDGEILRQRPNLMLGYL